jgi:hypothetical protein
MGEILLVIIIFIIAARRYSWAEKKADEDGIRRPFLPQTPAAYKFDREVTKIFFGLGKKSIPDNYKIISDVEEEGQIEINGVKYAPVVSEEEDNLNDVEAEINDVETKYPSCTQCPICDLKSLSRSFDGSDPYVLCRNNNCKFKSYISFVHSCPKCGADELLQDFDKSFNSEKQVTINFKESNWCLNCSGLNKGEI